MLLFTNKVHHRMCVLCDSGLCTNSTTLLQMLFHVWVSEDKLMTPTNGYNDDNYNPLKVKLRTSDNSKCFCNIYKEVRVWLKFIFSLRRQQHE